MRTDGFIGAAALAVGSIGCHGGTEEEIAWEGRDPAPFEEPEQSDPLDPPEDLGARRKAPRSCDPIAWGEDWQRAQSTPLMPAERPWEEAGLVPAQILTGGADPQALLLARDLEHCTFDNWAATCLVGRVETARMQEQLGLVDGWTRDSNSPVLDLWASHELSVDDLFLVPPTTKDNRWYGLLALEGVNVDARIFAGESQDAQRWEIDWDRPALGQGAAGAFDERGVTDPVLWTRGDETLMFYVGMQGPDRRPQIGLARYTDRGWQRVSTDPVIAAGAAGDFDGWGVAGPNLLHFADCYVLYYGALDLEGNASITVATSEDGYDWKARGRPILQRVPYTWEDSGVFDPVVYVHENQVAMLYRGASIADIGGVGLAVLSN